MDSEMTPTAEFCCTTMQSMIAEDSCPLVFISKFREYGILVLDGGTSYQLISVCPWCGKQLPHSLRDRWFNELELAGFDPGADKIPEKYTSDRWWRSDGRESIDA
jgi:hypothetical protein